MEQRTVDSILQSMEDMVTNKQVISPGWWVQAALYLTALIGEEHEKLITLESSIARERAAYIEEGRKIGEAKILVEATDEYKDMQRQKAKIKQIDEFIRIAKRYSRLKEEEYIHGQ